LAGLDPLLTQKIPFIGTAFTDILKNNRFGCLDPLLTQKIPFIGTLSLYKLTILSVQILC
jgi:hypothetical protein